MGASEMRQIAGWILDGLRNHEDEEKLALIASEVEAMCERFPVPGL